MNEAMKKIYRDCEAMLDSSELDFLIMELEELAEIKTQEEEKEANTQRYEMNREHEAVVLGA